MLANMIFNRFKDNLSKVYNVSEDRKTNGGKRVVYTDKTEIKPTDYRELTFISDYKNDLYSVCWSCWIVL